MDKKNLLQKIIRLAHDFYKKGDKSIYSLLEEINYKKFSDNISELDIKIELQNNPKYIEDWLLWSSDKRTSSGWYFINEKNRYEVGYLLEENELKKIFFKDKLTACANFIKNELDSIIE